VLLASAGNNITVTAAQISSGGTATKLNEIKDLVGKKLKFVMARLVIFVLIYHSRSTIIE
jgi:tRNA A37 threonylcarbamoyladenosine synthetase subunit TsaC/SUA5/YrdC